MNIRRADSSQIRSLSPQNLLDSLPTIPEQDIIIHTFNEFKQQMRNFQIKPLGKISGSSIAKEKKPLRQSRSLWDGSEDGISQTQIRLSTEEESGTSSPSNNMIYQSLNLRQKRTSAAPGFLELITEDREHLQASTLGHQSTYHYEESVVASKRSMRRGSGHSNLNLDILEHSIRLESHSAHSSRSFNGYQQINQYQLRDRLGKGAFSEVFLGIDVESKEGTKYAIKVMELKKIKGKIGVKAMRRSSLKSQKSESDDEQTDQNDLKNIISSDFVRNQIAILKKLNHQYITKLYDVLVDRQKDKVYLVLEYCSNGFINQAKDSFNDNPYRKLLQSQCRRYFRQLSLALNYIHSIVGIAHRDIKPQNILLSGHDQVRLSDFGLGTMMLQGGGRTGTKLFMPPDQSEENQKDLRKGDIWASGITLIIMLSGKLLEFKEGQILDLPKQIEVLKNHVSEECFDFIQKCLDANSANRMKADQMIMHPWIGNMSNGSQLLEKREKVEITKEDEEKAVKGVEKRVRKNK